MAATQPLPGAVLLCLDLQDAFLAALPERERIVRRCRLSLAAAAGLGLRVVFTEQVPQKLGPTLSELRALAPDAPVLPKTSFSAFGDGRFEEWVREHEIEHVLLCGIETPICLYQTAVDALNADLQVTVLADAVGGRRADDAACALASLARAGVHVLPVETVLYSLLRDAQHPFFKAFTQLVKSHG